MLDSKHKPLKRKVTKKKKSNRIPDATLLGKVSQGEDRFNDSGETGEVNAPPLEFGIEDLEEFHRQEAEKEQKRLETSSQTKTYDNGKNVWQLITKTYNDFLSWEHVTTAMNVPGGVLVCVKEAIGQKSDSTMAFVPGACVRKVTVVDNGIGIEKWVIL